jgi:hypothetical protein
MNIAGIKIFFSGENMKRINETDIKEILGAVQAINEAPFEYLAGVLQAEQPPLYEYLYAVEPNGLSDAERMVLLQGAVMGWHIVKESCGAGTIIDSEYLYNQLEENIDLLEERDRDLGDFDEALFSVVDESAQPVLLGFLMDYVVEQQDEYGGAVSDEVIPVIVLHLKTVIESLLVNQQ